MYCMSILLRREYRIQFSTVNLFHCCGLGQDCDGEGPNGATQKLKISSLVLRGGVALTSLTGKVNISKGSSANCELVRNVKFYFGIYELLKGLLFTLPDSIQASIISTLKQFTHRYLTQQHITHITHKT